MKNIPGNENNRLAYTEKLAVMSVQRRSLLCPYREAHCYDRTQKLPVMSVQGSSLLCPYEGAGCYIRTEDMLVHRSLVVYLIHNSSLLLCLEIYTGITISILL